MGSALYTNRRLLLLVLLLVVATGVHALTSLPRQEDPRIETRYALLLTAFPGASAERVEALVTERLEREVREMVEVKETISTSRAGMSVMSVELRDEVQDLDTVWSRLRDRLDDVAADLPAGAGKPDLRDREEIDAYTLVAALVWRGGGEANLAVLRRLALDLRDDLRDVSGTGYARLFGAPPEEVSIALDADAAAALGLTPADLARRIQASDAKVAAGVVRGSQGNLLVEVSGELDSLARIRDLVVAVGDAGQTVRLQHVAAIEKGIEDPPSELAFFDGRPGVAVAARMRPGDRTDVWAARVRAAVEERRAALPETVSLDVVFDQSRYVEARLAHLGQNLLLGVLFVITVTFLLMGWRAAFVVGATLPLASLMVLTGLNLLDVPIEQMSVMGLIIALGMLIDNAIVMTDEVGHELRAGVPPVEALRGSVAHLAVPLLGSTLTTILAFMPMILVPGAIGEFISSVGISVVLAISASYVLALTVVPALVGLLGPGRRGPAWLRRGLAPGLLARPYRAVLRWMLVHPVVAMLFAAALPALGFVLAARLPEQFFPPAERDQMRVEIELPPQATIHETRALALAVGDVLREDAEVEHVHWFLGRNAPKFYYNMTSGREGSPNYAEALVELGTAQKALAHVRALQVRLDRRFPEALVLVRPLEQGPPFDWPVELRVYGPDLDVLQRLGEEARSILADVEDVTHTRTSIAGSRPKLKVELDEASLRRTGLLNTDVAAQLGAGFEGVTGGSLLEGTEELSVRVRLAREARDAVDDALSLDLLPPAAAGERRPIPLAAVGEPLLVPEEGAITRRDGRRLNTVGGLVTAGVLPSVVLERFQRALERADFDVPDGYTLAFGGEQEERNEAVDKLLASVAVLAVAMITVLVLSFRSFRLAGTIFVIGGLSIGLAMLALAVFDQNFGFMAIVGTMGLVGLAINDSIAVLAGLRQDEAVRAGDVEATVDRVFRATRHVLSTTLTTVAGFLPLILAGGQLWPPLALSIAGGVVGATVLALCFLPAAHRALVARPGAG